MNEQTEEVYYYLPKLNTLAIHSLFLVCILTHYFMISWLQLASW